MIDHTVVGWNGTEASRRAADWAIARAASTGDVVRLVHVFPGEPEEPGDVEVADAVAATETEVARLGDVAPHVSVSAEVVIGSPADELRGLSDESCLIVVGTDERGTPTRTSGWSLGSRLAGTCPGPVAVVPDPGTGERHGVVVGVGRSERDEAALDFAALEAIARVEPLHLVHSWQRPPTAGLNGLNTEFVDWFRATHQEYLSGCAAELLRRYPPLSVQEHFTEASAAVVLHEFGASASLLVVGTRGFGPVRRFLLGSTSHALLLSIDAPTVVVPPGTDA
ncbi:universal stress protein [Plantibacter flavus]|uniref:universal stress protein n=1 Tax=Plantibacter flavus TaxID=150123 RepID=UPI003F140F11